MTTHDPEIAHGWDEASGAGVEGAAPSSRHQFGDAADVVVENLRAQGFVRLSVDGHVLHLDDAERDGVDLAAARELLVIGNPVFARHAVSPAGAECAEELRRADRTRNGDGYPGWPEEAPFHRVLLTAAP